MENSVHWVLIQISDAMVSAIVNACGIAKESLNIVSSCECLPEELIRKKQLMLVVNVDASRIERFCQLYLTSSMRGHVLILTTEENKKKWDDCLERHVISLRPQFVLDSGHKAVLEVARLYQKQVRANCTRLQIQSMLSTEASLLPQNYGNPTVLGADKLIEALPFAMAIIEHPQLYLIKTNKMFNAFFSTVIAACERWDQFLDCFQVVEQTSTSLLLQQQEATRVVSRDKSEASLVQQPKLWKVMLNSEAYPGYTLVYMDDVTENHWYRTQVKVLNKQKEMALQLQKQKDLNTKMLQRSYVGETASGIAHQINQPLATLSTSIQLALSYLDSNEPQKTIKVKLKLEKAAQMCQDVGEIIHSIKASIQEKKPHYALFNSTLLEKQLAIRFVHDPIEITFINRLKRAVLTGVKIIEQALIILTQNSLDHAHECGQEHVDVVITIEEDQGNLIVVHQDNCGGVPSDIVDSIFSPFYTTKEYGQGIGLSLVVSFMEALRGNLEYLDAPSNGAVFKLSVPIPSEHALEDKLR